MLGIASMLSAGAVVAGATAASAHTGASSTTCEALTVNLTNFQPVIPGSNAVTHIEYLFEHAPNGKYKTRWERDKNWNAQGNPNSTGWRLVNPLTTMTVVDKPATPGRANHVTVTINGTTVADADFGASYTHTFPFVDKYQANDWSVVWTAYDGNQWSGSTQGTSVACPLPATPDKDATASTSTTPGTCLAPGSVSFSIRDAIWDDANDTSDGSRDATAKPGHAFANGATTATVTYAIPPQTPYKDAACMPTFAVVQVCGNITITYHNNSKWDRWPDYRIEGDGVVAKDAGSGPYYTTVMVKAGETKVILDHDFAEDYNGGSAKVTYQDILGAERDIDTAAQTVTVDTDCAPPPPVVIPNPPAVLASVAVAPPVLTPPTCTAAGELRYDEANGYSWNRKDDNGVVVLTAIAKPGFTLVGQTSWSYTVAQLAQLHGAKDCPPAVIPPEVEGVKNTAPPTPPVVKGVKHEAAAALPRTGSESGVYGAAGLLLLLVGSGLVLATRQRSTQDRAH